MNLHDFLTHLSSEPGWLHAGPVTPVTRASNGDTPLHAAIWARDDEAARQLIDAGADVNAPGEDDYTPIHAALALLGIGLFILPLDWGTSTVAYDLLVGGVFVPIVGAMIWRRATTAGALASIALGSALVVIFLIRGGLDSDLPIYCGLAGSLLAYVAVSLCTGVKTR